MLGFWYHRIMAILVGIDEVGRGCLAGPVVAGAVILHQPIDGLTDSKLLSKAKRQHFSQLIHQTAAVGLGWVSAEELDAVGLTAAVRLAMQRAVDQLHSAFDEIIIDGSFNFLATEPRARTLIKADLTIPAVSAASIVAKVARDNWMSQIAALEYPGYGFEKHVGYGTAVHMAALTNLGICKIHRKSFKPIQTFC